MPKYPHFAINCHKLVEKGWCNENASAINLISRKSFAANERQVKHTSTVSKPSISFHTLVQRADDEDIANDEIRTHDLTLEVHNITKELQTQTLDSS